jgi:hypothetical protein
MVWPIMGRDWRNLRSHPQPSQRGGSSESDLFAPNSPSFSEFQYFRPIAICMPVWYCMAMKRTALFLKEEQLKKLQTLSDKTGAPVAELIRRAIDKYLLERAKELK